jgi:prolipoprotein diacylglyceryltransferase
VEFTLLAAALLSVGAVYIGVRTQGPAESRARLWDTALGAVMAGLFLGRLAAMALAGTNPITHPADILIVRSGVDTGWASLGALTTAVVAGRRNPVDTLDGLAAPGLAGLAVWHGSCLLRGACLGTPSELPWAIAASGSGVTRHPVEVYSALLLIAGAAVLAWWARRPATPGRLGGAALFLAAAVRLATEPMRPALGSGPVGWYAAGIVAGSLLFVAGRWAATTCTALLSRAPREHRGEP